MNNEPIIIIGAGAAGLLAARELSAAGIPVIVLEAAARPGGRIHTLLRADFTGPVEAGAEFIHGPLPITMQLLTEAGIPHLPVKSKMVRVRKGEWIGEGAVSGDWDELMQKMQSLEQDLPVAEFLSAYFPGERYTALRESVQRFAEGYDLADIHKASTLALFREWEEEGQGDYRVKGGYVRLIDFLIHTIQARGSQVHLSSPVHQVEWERGRVRVTTRGDKGEQHFVGSRLITTVSLGVLEETSIHFSPAIPTYMQAARQMGYGDVTKILLQFSQPFWNKKDSKISFILSDESIPTWWTPSRYNKGLLTGWLTGEPRRALLGLDETTVIDRCIASLASIFDMDQEELKGQLLASLVLDWATEPYILGGYSFDTVDSAVARKTLCTPIAETLYFAGEALYEGPSPGTVEAALTSGKEVAEKIATSITGPTR